MKPKLYAVCGYNHDPDTPKHSPTRHSPPHETEGHYNIWARMLPDHELHGIRWYSAVQGRDLFRAWRNGCRNTYVYAYLKCVPNAVNKIVMQAEPGSYVIAHSLGTRVVLQALKMRPGLFKKVLFLNGAEVLSVARPIIEANPDTEFLNICVSTDDVLRFAGSWFAPKWGKEPTLGQHGLNRPLPGNVKQYFLDHNADKGLLSKKFGTNVDGDNPDGFGDHSYSFLNEENWPIYREFFSG